LIGSSLDPRSKLIVLLAATCVLMTFHRWFELAIALGILLIVTLLLHLGLAWLGLLKGLGFAAFTFFIVAGLAFDLATAVLAALRLLSIGTAFFLFFQTTSPEALSNALIKTGAPYRALRYFPALAGPLLIQAFQLADELAEAMEARGFGAPGRRFRYEPNLRLLDWAIMIGSIAAALTVIFI